MKRGVDTSAFRSAMREYETEVKAIIEKQNKKAANDLQTMMKRLAPRESGTLESSIVTEAVDNGYRVAVGGATTTRQVGSRKYVMGSGKARKGKPTDYAKIQEFGAPSVNIPAKPYINPSRSRVRRAYRECGSSSR